MAIATAEVQIIADTSKFERDLSKKLRQAGRESGREYSESFKKATEKTQAGGGVNSKQYAKTGQSAGREFSKSFEKAASSSKNTGKSITKRLAKDVQKDGTKAGQSWGSTFAKGAIAPIAGIGKALTSAVDAATGVGSQSGGMFGPLAVSAGLAVTALIPLIGYLGEIPAMIGGAVASVSTLMVAFNGVGEAIKNGFSDKPEDIKKFQESLGKLAPEAQTVVKDIVGLKPALDDLQKSVQGAFFKPLVGQMGQLSQVVSGPLQKGMTSLAGAFGEAGKALVQFVSSGAGRQGIQQIFDGLTVSIQKLTPALDPLMKGFTAFAAVGAKSLGNLGPMLADIGNKMAAFAGSGGLDRMLQGAAGAASQLGQAFSALWPGLKAAVDMFNVIGGSVRAAMIPAFAGLSQTMQAIAPVFQQVFGMLGQVLNAVIPPAAAALSGMGKILAALLLPALQALGPVVGQVLGALGPGLMQAIQGAIPPLVAFAGLIGRGLADAIRFVTPVILGLLPVFQATFAAIVPVVQSALGIISGAFTFIGGVITGNWTKAFDGLKGIVASFGKFVSDFFSGLGGLLVQAGKNIVNGLVQGITAMGKPVGDAMNGIAGTIRAYLPFSPAKMGPLSGSGNPERSGRKIGAMLAAGITSQHGAVAKAMDGLVSAQHMAPTVLPSAPAVPMSPVQSVPMQAQHGNGLTGSGDIGLGGGQRQYWHDQSRNTTVHNSNRFQIMSPAVDPAVIARRAANRVARLSTA